jgi:membrane protease YdiL (CAAX protease family)
MLDVTVPPVSPEPPRARPFGPIWSLIVALGAFALGFVPAIMVALLTIAIFHPSGLSALVAVWHGEDLSADPALIERVEWLLIASAQIFAALFILAVAVMRGGKDFRTLLALNFQVPVKPLCIGMLAVAVYQIAGMVLEAAFPSITEWLEELLKLPEDMVALCIAAFGVVAVAPLCEELMFRGFLYTSFRERWGFASALIGTSVLFALAHFEFTLLYALLVLPFAFVLGWAREASKGIALPVMLHMTVNLLSFFSLLVTTRVGG